MASSYLQAFPTPKGFYQILAELTKDILRDQPTNIVEYAALFFEKRDKNSQEQKSTSIKNISDGSVRTDGISGAASVSGTEQSVGTQKSVTTQEVKKYVNHLPSSIDL